MAGTIVHYYVMKKYLEDNKIAVIPENFNELKGGADIATYFLGATGPDIFYMLSSTGQIAELADFMHYKNCGKFAIDLYNQGTELSKILAKGFVSHMATDLVIHPFVNSLIGKYQENIIDEIEIPGIDILDLGPLSSHNLVEMAQDYYIMNHKLKVTKLHNALLTYKIAPNVGKLSKILHKSIVNVYGNHNEHSEARISIFLNYFTSTEEGILNSPIVKISKHLTVLSGALFLGKRINEFANTEMYTDLILDDEFAYQNAIKHLSGEKNLMDFIAQAAILTEKMIDDLENNGGKKLLKPWNLDSGLCIEPTVEDNEIKICFKSYEDTW